MNDIIVTPRLHLVPMNAAFVDAVLELRRDDAARALGIRLTDAWPTGNERWLEIRRKQLRDDPSVAPWLSRAVVLEGTLIGRAGYHHPPVGGETEFGYEIDPPYRRQGYASEAVRGFISWGFSQPGLRTIVACVAPDNEISIHMVKRFGFRFSRMVTDEVDGTEMRFELTRDAYAE